MVVKLLVNILLLIGIVFGCVEAVILLSPFKKKDLVTDFAAAIIDKQAMLKKVRSPKIVFIGGSSVAYGVDTKLLQDSLDVPVLNMSFQYFLGSDFLFRQVEGQLNDGDVLVASFEYIVSEQGEIKEKMRAAELYPKANDWFEYAYVTDQISALLRYKIEGFRRIILRLYDGTPFEPSVADTTSVFFRDAINENGDLVSHLNNPPQRIDACFTVSDDESPFYSTITNIGKNARVLQKKGVRVLYTFPSYESNSYKRDEPLIAKFYPKLRRLRGVELIDKPADNVYPDSLFQDMCYHLNAEGRRIRTLELLKKLKRLK